MGTEILRMIEEAIIIFSIILLVTMGTKYAREIKDKKLFDMIKDNSFKFSARHYKNNRQLLSAYINAYITYGYNVKCGMTEEEFRTRLLRFISAFSRMDLDRENTLTLMLDNISESVRICSKCGDVGCCLRARYLLKKIEIDYKYEIDNGSEELTEYLEEIHLLTSV